MRVLVTRPFDDAVETAAQLAARGHRSIVSPLLKIRVCEEQAISLNGVQAILATSSNGVRALSQRSERRDIPLFAVGEHTASVARGLGFFDVKSAHGDAQALMMAVPTWARPECGTLLYVTGTREPNPLVAGLRALSYDVRTVVLYRSIPATRLSSESRQALRTKIVDAVLLFSPNTAKMFVHCIVIDDLQDCCGPLIACCISEAAAAPLKSLGLKDVRWPTHPDQAGMLSLLD